MPSSTPIVFTGITWGTGNERAGKENLTALFLYLSVHTGRIVFILGSVNPPGKRKLHSWICRLEACPGKHGAGFFTGLSTFRRGDGEVGQETGEMLGTLFFVTAFTPAAAAQPVMVFRMAQQPAERHPCRFDGGLAEDHDVADFT